MALTNKERELLWNENAGKAMEAMIATRNGVSLREIDLPLMAKAAYNVADQMDRERVIHPYPPV